MTAPDGIEAFAITAVEYLGGAAEERAAGLYTVLWPAAAPGDAETRQLAFDPEVIEEEPDAELVTFASPTLEQIVQLATASGRVARAFLKTTAHVSRGTAERLARSYRFLDAVWSSEAPRPWWLPVGVFLFRARYLSDSREEDLLEVAVSLADRRILRRLRVQRLVNPHDQPGHRPQPRERLVIDDHPQEFGGLHGAMVQLVFPALPVDEGLVEVQQRASEFAKK